MQTATQLFAAALGRNQSERCFFCGGRCGRQFGKAAFVKDSFSGHAEVVSPASDYVCTGCVCALSEKATVTFPDGTQRPNQKTRTYSWVVTSQSVTAASKAHRDYLLSILLDPPDPPYVIVIADSGKKHLLYRGVVSHERIPVTLLFETEIVRFDPPELKRTLKICKKLAAACGQPVLKREKLTDSQAMAAIRYHHDDSLPGTWHQISGEPLSRLATFFTPKKEDCRHEYPPADR